MEPVTRLIRHWPDRSRASVETVRMPCGRHMIGELRLICILISCVRCLQAWCQQETFRISLLRQVGAVKALLGTPLIPCLRAVLHADAASWHAGKYIHWAIKAQIVDPREHYQGSLRRTLKKYPHIGKTIPAMGYSAKQVPHSGRMCPCKVTCMLARLAQPCAPRWLSGISLCEVSTGMSTVLPRTCTCTCTDLGCLC